MPCSASAGKRALPGHCPTGSGDVRLQRGFGDPPAHGGRDLALLAQRDHAVRSLMTGAGFGAGKGGPPRLPRTVRALAAAGTWLDPIGAPDRPEHAAGAVIFDTESQHGRPVNGRAMQTWPPLHLTPNPPGPPMTTTIPHIAPALATTRLRELLAPSFDPQQGWKSGRSHGWFTTSSKLYKLEFYGRVPSWSFEFALHLRPKYPAHMKTAVTSLAGFNLEVDLNRLADAHGLPLSLSWIAAGGENQYTTLVDTALAAERAAAELAAVLAHALPLLAGIDSWQKLDHWANRVPDADCPFRCLRRPATWTPLNHHADLAIAKAADAPDYAARASDKLSRYRECGTPMVGFLEAFVAASGLPT